MTLDQARSLGLPIFHLDADKNRKIQTLFNKEYIEVSFDLNTQNAVLPHKDNENPENNYGVILTMLPGRHPDRAYDYQPTLNYEYAKKMVHAGSLFGLNMVFKKAYSDSVDNLLPTAIKYGTIKVK